MTFSEFRVREGHIVKRPGDDIAGYWLMLSERERDALVAEYRRVAARLATADAVLEAIDDDHSGVRAVQTFNEWVAEAEHEARAQAMEP